MGNIILNEIDKIYENGFHAVHQLSLDVHDGEFLVLVGPSGCGKSTALRMIAGLETISGGELHIGGRRVNDLDPKDRDIAMVFQSYALYPHLTVRDNIAFALKLKKMPKDEINRRVDEAAKILELTEYLDRKPGRLSGGQRQRVAMGRAIVRQPQAFLMDEPLSNLDAKLRVQMRAEISRLQRHLNVTTVYVTHDQIEAMTMGDRVAVLSRGVLQQVDTPQNLYDFPDNIFVATFIGSPQMNMLKGSYDAAAATLKVGSNTLTVPESVRSRAPLARRLRRPRHRRRHPARAHRRCGARRHRRPVSPHRRRDRSRGPRLGSPAARRSRRGQGHRRGHRERDAGRRPEQRHRGARGAHHQAARPTTPPRSPSTPATSSCSTWSPARPFAEPHRRVGVQHAVHQGRAMESEGAVTVSSQMDDGVAPPGGVGGCHSQAQSERSQTQPSAGTVCGSS